MKIHPAWHGISARALLPLLSILLFSTPAPARTPPPSTTAIEAEPAPSGALAPLPVQIRNDDCRRLLQHHRPEDDVTYQPGRTRRGTAVVPADMTDASVWSNGYEDGFQFLLAVDPTRGHPASKYGFLATSEIPIGMLAFDARSGRLTLNGTPLSDDVVAVVSEQCRKSRPDRRPSRGNAR